mmetsp:Transcript_900/g.2151  ORF Transcript_900/g.2151 Transcript_900/m.2151 type:complete len:211 (-) Transcript_900:701-1333(-)
MASIRLQATRRPCGLIRFPSAATAVAAIRSLRRGPTKQRGGYCFLPPGAQLSRRRRARAQPPVPCSPGPKARPLRLAAATPRAARPSGKGNRRGKPTGARGRGLHAPRGRGVPAGPPASFQAHGPARWTPRRQRWPCSLPTAPIPSSWPQRRLHASFRPSPSREPPSSPRPPPQARCSREPALRRILPPRRCAPYTNRPPPSPPPAWPSL